MSLDPRSSILALLLCLIPIGMLAQEAQEATSFTRALHESALATPPEGGATALADAQRGFIATLDPLNLPREDGQGLAYSLEGLDFLADETAPPTVHPNLWRQARLNALHPGLFEVTDGIYQVRAFDLANMTLIRGQTGWIVIDPLTSLETARAALELANRELGTREIRAIIVTHSHADHFGGLGIVPAEKILSGEVALIAPRGLVREALSENVQLGNAMVRRAEYMFGLGLPRSPRGFLSAGLGAALASGQTTLLPVNDPISEPFSERGIDGVEMVFQNAPGAEAPVEILVYFPQHKALCMSEITSRTLHNVYTLRGAKTRDARLWSSHIDRAREHFASKSDVLFASHHWPIWGRDRLTTFLEKQRDLYKFLHDQTLRLANHGYSANEIAARITLPKSLGQELYNHGFYGTVSHNVRAIYTTYLGFFDGNPAHLDPLRPIEESRRYVEFMGGPETLLKRTRHSFAQGEYRWVVTVLDHLIRIDPDHREARNLQADALEQLGYQAESAVWRNFYLSGAQELRHGVAEVPAPDLRFLLLGASIEQVFDALAVRLDPEKAADSTFLIQFTFPDLERNVLLQIQNSVLHAFADQTSDQAQTSLTLSSLDFKRLIGGLVSPTDLLRQERLNIVGDPAIWSAVLALFDTFDPRFPLVTPLP